MLRAQGVHLNFYKLILFCRVKSELSGIFKCLKVKVTFRYKRSKSVISSDLLDPRSGSGWILVLKKSLESGRILNLKKKLNLKISGYDNLAEILPDPVQLVWKDFVFCDQLLSVLYTQIIVFWIFNIQKISQAKQTK